MRGHAHGAREIPPAGPRRELLIVVAEIKEAAAAKARLLAALRGEALGVLTTGAYSLPTHFTLLGADGGASSIEIADESYADASCSIQGLRDTYAHTNHPLRLVFSEAHQPSANSIERLRQLAPDVSDFTAIGGVVQRPEDVGKDDSVTLVTVIINPAGREFVAYDHLDMDNVRITL